MFPKCKVYFHRINATYVAIISHFYLKKYKAKKLCFIVAIVQEKQYCTI